MRKLRMLAAALLTALLLTVPALADFNQGTLDGIIMITSGAPNAKGDMEYWRGTGFFIGSAGEAPQHIVTNCHVVEEFILAGKALGGGELRVLFDQNDEAEAYLVDYDAEKDVAILRLAEPTDKRSPLPLKEPEESSLGSEIYAVGYPSAADLTIQAVNSFSQKDASVTTGSISRFLVDSSGAVIGVNTAGSNLDQNLFYAVSVSEVLPLLEKNSIPYAKAEAPKNNSTMLYIGGTVAAVAIAAVIAVVLRKKKKAPAPQTQKTEVRAAVPVLRSMSPQHGGMIVQLHGQPVQLGRDAAVCRIAYRDGTPGVSGRHCQVYFDEGERLFVVTDLKSTYGTFLANGQRIAPDTPVKLTPKSSFYLGESGNTVYVDLE